ncbi:hypothetical protein NA78x_001635 [Anatilimnocola sp. NA78]|uniref:hypothetical protein n=1 Tax=Anatilimnocola sp. NA78 TaxID=3415683 RepID=UPI003CE54505
MSFFDDFFVNDHQRIRNLQSQVERLRTSLSRPNPFAPKQGDIEQLQVEVAELRLQVAVLIQVLIQSGIATQPDLERCLADLDAADGKIDGQFDGNPVTGEPAPPPPPEQLPKIRV